MRKKVWLAILLVIMIGIIAQAEEVSPVDVDNYSFESPGTVKCKNWDGETTYPDVPGWTDGDLTATDSGVEDPSVGDASDGTWIGFMKASDGAVYQVTSHIIGAGKDYTLTVDSRATSGAAGANLELTMELFYDVAGVQTTLATQTVIVTDRVSPYPWGTFDLTLDSASVPAAAIGNPIGIKFDHVTAAGGWLGIDNVRLTYTSGGAVDPIPGDGTPVNKNLLTQLSWTLLPNIATCRVYFGTDPNLLTMDSIYFNPAVESVDIDDFPNYSTPLAEDTYYWRVDCWDVAYTDPNSSDPNYFGGLFWSFNATSSPVFGSISPSYQAKFADETADAITASFSGSELTYEWFKSDDDATDTLADDVSVGTGDTLSLGTLGLDDAAWYYCVADNGSQTVSTTARVSIKRQIIHYTFDGDVEDDSGNALHGTLFGDESNFVDDAIFGQALEFDGTSDYVQCPNDLDLTYPAFDDFTPGMTVTVWAKPDTTANWGRFVDFGSGAGVNNILFTRNGTSTTLRLDTSNGTLDAANTIALDEWQMFAVTMDGDGNAVLYKNGLPVNKGTVGLPALAPRTLNYVGESNWVDDSFYSGLMDDLQVWNYALTEDNIADMYAAGAGDFCRYPENVGEFDFNGNCKVDLPDLAVFVSTWLNCGLYPICP